MVLMAPHRVGVTSPVDNVMSGISYANACKPSDQEHVQGQALWIRLSHLVQIRGRTLARADMSKVDLPIFHQNGNCATCQAGTAHNTQKLFVDDRST